MSHTLLLAITASLPGLVVISIYLFSPERRQQKALLRLLTHYADIEHIVDPNDDMPFVYRVCGQIFSFVMHRWTRSADNADRWGQRRSTTPYSNSSMHRLESWLYRQVLTADLPLRPLDVVVFFALSMSGALLLSSALFGTPVLAPVGPALFVFFIKRRQKKRRKKLSRQLPEVLGELRMSLDAGMGIRGAIQSIVQENEPPIAIEFQTMLREIELGGAFEDALENMQQRLQDPDIELLADALRMHRETGGNLVEMLGNIEVTVRERITIEGQIKALTAQARMGGYVVSCLPLLLAFALYFIDRPMVTFYWSNLLGEIAAGVMIVLEAVAFVLMRKIATVSA